MRTASILVIFVLPLITAMNCGKPAPQPPDQFMVIRTFFKSAAGADLLDSSTSGSFKKSEVSIISKVEINGVVKDMNYYAAQGLNFFVDSKSGFYYIELMLPTTYGKTPIETIITLSPSVTDTVTYTFNGTTYPSFPNQVFYNKVLVWDIANTPATEHLWAPITIVK
jgi:hypothetical protein